MQNHQSAFVNGMLLTRGSSFSIEEVVNELSSSVNRLTKRVETFQAFLAYSQGTTFLQKRLAEQNVAASSVSGRTLIFSVFGSMGNKNSKGSNRNLKEPNRIPTRFSRNSRSPTKNCSQIPVLQIRHQ